MDRGWSLKKLHRLIVTSATYRQSSRTTPELRERDPTTGCWPAGRASALEAEAVRDVALAASGLLNPKVGGPPHPPAAAGVPVPAAGQLRAEGLECGKGTGSLPPVALHLPLPLGAAPGVADLRRAQRRFRLRPPRPLRHAAASADDAEPAGLPRSAPRAGPAHADRRRQDRRRPPRLRLPPLPGPQAGRG